MPSASLATNIDAGGVSINKSVVRSADGAIGYEIALPAAKVGQLTTRTDAETGELTMVEGHGIASADVIDLYWATGARYGITVGTVSGETVPIGADNSGTGDDLPTNLTAITAAVQVEANVAIDGDNLSVLVICLDTPEAAGKGQVDFLSDSPASVEQLDLQANVPRAYDIDGGAVNAFTGDPIVSLVASNGSAVQAAVLKIAGLQDVTP
jgi:hypothetical protein